MVEIPGYGEYEGGGVNSPGGAPDTVGGDSDDGGDSGGGSDPEPDTSSGGGDTGGDTQTIGTSDGGTVEIDRDTGEVVDDETEKSAQSAENVGNVVKETSRNLEPAEPGDAGTEFSGEETSEVVGPAPADDDSGSDSSDDRRRNERGEVIAPESLGGPADQPTPREVGDTIDPDAAPGTQEQQFINQENQDLETSDADIAPGLTGDEVRAAAEFEEATKGTLNNQPGDPEDVNPEAFRPEDDTTKETAQRAREVAQEQVRQAAESTDLLDRDDFTREIAKAGGKIRVSISAKPSAIEDAEQQIRSELRADAVEQAAQQNEGFSQEDFSATVTETDDGLTAEAELTESTRQELQRQRELTGQTRQNAFLGGGSEVIRTTTTRDRPTFSRQSQTAEAQRLLNIDSASQDRPPVNQSNTQTTSAPNRQADLSVREQFQTVGAKLSLRDEFNEVTPDTNFEEEFNENTPDTGFEEEFNEVTPNTNFEDEFNRLTPDPDEITGAAVAAAPVAAAEPTPFGEIGVGGIAAIGAIAGTAATFGNDLEEPEAATERELPQQVPVEQGELDAPRNTVDESELDTPERQQRSELEVPEERTELSPEELGVPRDAVVSGEAEITGPEGTEITDEGDIVIPAGTTQVAKQNRFEDEEEEEAEDEDEEEEEEVVVEVPDELIPDEEQTIGEEGTEASEEDLVEEGETEEATEEEQQEEVQAIQLPRQRQAEADAEPDETQADEDFVERQQRDTGTADAPGDIDGGGSIDSNFPSLIGGGAGGTQLPFIGTDTQEQTRETGGARPETDQSPFIGSRDRQETPPRFDERQGQPDAVGDQTGNQVADAVADITGTADAVTDATAEVTAQPTVPGLANAQIPGFGNPTTPQTGNPNVNENTNRNEQQQQQQQTQPPTESQSRPGPKLPFALDGDSDDEEFEVGGGDAPVLTDFLDPTTGSRLETTEDIQDESFFGGGFF